MTNLIQKFFKKDRFNKSQTRKEFSRYFLSLPEHQWIVGRPAEDHFEKLFQHLPLGVLDVLIHKYPVIFVPSETLKQKNKVGHVLHNTVVVFPEFQKLLMTRKSASVAYLAHELAFILYELEAPELDPLMAEIEADKFVCDLGLAEELEQFLLMLDETIEKRLRLTYLTINHFTKNSN